VNKCGTLTVTSRDRWYRRHVSVWITCVESLHCFGPLSISIHSLTFNFDFHQFSPCSSPILLSSHYHIHCTLTTPITIMSDNCRRSPSPSAHCSRADDTSDEPMSHQDRARRRSDKRRAPHSPSPRRSCPPSREGRHEKRRRVTARDASPSPDRWCATTTGLLLHDRDHQCPTCLEYQKHVSLDIVLETSSIMDAREDCLRCLACVFGWNARMSGLEDNLASMRREHDYWCKCAEEAEKASTFSQQQTSAAFEQARLLSMYIPSARPVDPWRNVSFLQGEGAG